MTTPISEATTEPLHPDLLPCVHEDPVFGHMLKHPLVVAPLPDPKLHVPYNRLYTQKQARIAAAEADGDLGAIIAMYERPFRLEAFLRYEHLAQGPKKWQLMAEVYIDTENAFELRAVWLRLFREALPYRAHLMDDDERERLASLPEQVTIYRGARLRETEGNLGVSWALDRKQAEWFARRFPGVGFVIKATVYRSDVVAFFGGRGEDEVIVLPESVTIKAVTAVKPGARQS